MEIQKIIFRGKRVDNGEWVYGYYSFDNRPTSRGTYITRYSGYSQLDYEVIPETVGQYTGLTDKNGKKIFEGDIVKFIAEKENGVFEVKYASSEFYADWYIKNNFMDITTSMKYLQCSSELEVIGNIFDNPEYKNKK